MVQPNYENNLTHFFRMLYYFAVSIKSGTWNKI